MVAWFAVIAMLGVFTAMPIKRQLINIEELPFPTGTATAETLHALHGEGSEAPAGHETSGGPPPSAPCSPSCGTSVAPVPRAGVDGLPFTSAGSRRRSGR